MQNESNAEYFSKDMQENESLLDTKRTLKSISSELIPEKQTTPENVCSQLMLQDTTLQSAPAQLDKFFSHFELPTLSKSEIIFQLVYLVALESGFCEKTAYDQYAPELHFSYVITSFFNRHNVHCLVQQKPKFTCDDSGTKFSMQLRNIISDQILANTSVNVNVICTNMTALITGDLMIVSLVPVDAAETAESHAKRSICLTIPRYVIGTVTKNGKKLLECLRNIEEFVLQLRNELFIPLRNYQFSLLELDSFPSLLGLPAEAYENIFCYLNDNQLKILANVNKLLYDIIVNSRIYEKRIIENEKPCPETIVKSSTSTITETETYY